MLLMIGLLIRFPELLLHIESCLQGGETVCLAFFLIRCGCFMYEIRGCGQIPVCPVFFHTHSLYRRNACPGKYRIDLPAVYEIPGIQAVMTDDFSYTSVYEHVAYGHQAAVPVDVFPYEVVSRIPCMTGQQQPSASACRVTHPLAGLDRKSVV